MIDLGGLVAHRLAIERDDDQRQVTVVGQELAFDDVILFQRLYDRVVGRLVLRQIVGHDRRRVARRIGLAARREHRDEPTHAVGQLQVDDRVSERFELRLLEKILPFHDDQHVVLARRETAIDLLVLVEFLRVGSKELRQAVVDLEPKEAEHGERRHRQDDERGEWQ